MMCFRTITARLRRFRDTSDGSYSIETAMIVPMLLWGMLATYTFVDSYRMQALNLRATYTISDLLTRQWEPVDGAFITGIGRFYEFLTNDSHDTTVRVTVVYYDEPSDSHKLVWSQVRGGGHSSIREADMPALSPSIPALANADSAIIVDTWMTYDPPFKVGIPTTLFTNRVVTSPRFVPQLQWTDENPGDYINDETHQDDTGDGGSI
jgi:Flp pilus assembly protein TadG